jgi:L-serine dehydratase
VQESVVAISVFDLFKIGIGPSSSHTVGPMRAAALFSGALAERRLLERTARLQVRLYGSLSATGVGHGSDRAVIMGLMGEWPDQIDPSSIEPRIAELLASGQLQLGGRVGIAFDWQRDMLLLEENLPYHPNAMTLSAFAADGSLLHENTYYSVGGGFVVDAEQAASGQLDQDHTVLPYDFNSAAQLLQLCQSSGLRVSELMMANEKAWRSEAEIRSGLMRLWHEENAAGGCMVTAPTNGAAGIIPAVLHYFVRFSPAVSEANVVDYLLAAAAIGILCKKNASISGAEVGCQGEVGSACAMAAAGLAEILGATPEQVENAAEIGLEHNLGLTCDPVGGLVQVPCIERNAIAAVKAINAAQMALRGDGQHFISLDRVIRTMRDTGADMHDKYKETSRGGLAVSAVEC